MNRKLPDTIRRNGIYYFKKRVPTDLLSTASFAGREYFQKSLKTRDPRIARRRADELDREFQQKCRQMRLEIAGLMPAAGREQSGSVLRTPDFTEIESAIQRFRMNFLADRPRTHDTHIESKWGSPNDPIFAGFPSSKWENEIIAHRQSLKGTPAETTMLEVDYEISKNGWDVDKDSPLYVELCEKYAAACIDAINQLAESKPGDDHHQYAAADNNIPTTLGRAVANYHVIKKHRTHMLKKLDTAYLAWNELIGTQSLSAITKRDVRNFISKLERVPCRLRAKQPNTSLNALINDARANDPEERRLSPRSIKDNYITPLSTALNLLRQDYPNEPNPFLGVKPDGVVRDPNRRKFTTDELNLIFRHPIFTGCLSRHRRNNPGRLVIRDHYFWAPIVALWTGMRAGEIASLRVDQVFVPELGYGEFPHIKVLSGKTKNAKRDVPVHPQLLEIGFGRYVASISSHGNHRAFPEWKKPEGKSLSSGASQKNFNNRVLEGFAEGANFHTFRHTLKTEMASKRNTVPEQHQRAILGHEQIDRDSDYLHLELEDYYDTFVAGVCFEGVDLAHLTSP